MLFGLSFELMKNQEDHENEEDAHWTNVDDSVKQFVSISVINSSMREHMIGKSVDMYAY